MNAPDPRLTAFAYRRQRLDGSASSALDAVEAALGVYAANPSGPLSILARAPSATALEVLALERDGLVVRGRAMRTSAFVLPASSAPMVTAATSQPLERFAWMLRAAGVAPDGFEAARAAVVRAAGKPRTARELRSAAALDGVDVARLISYLALCGDLVTLGAVSVTSNEHRYVALRAATCAPWEPGTSPAVGDGRCTRRRRGSGVACGRIPARLRACTSGGPCLVGRDPAILSRRGDLRSRDRGHRWRAPPPGRRRAGL